MHASSSTYPLFIPCDLTKKRMYIDSSLLTLDLLRQAGDLTKSTTDLITESGFCTFPKYVSQLAELFSQCEINLASGKV